MFIRRILRSPQPKTPLYYHHTIVECLEIVGTKAYLVLSPPPCTRFNIIFLLTQYKNSIYSDRTVMDIEPHQGVRKSTYPNLLRLRSHMLTHTVLNPTKNYPFTSPPCDQFAREPFVQLDKTWLGFVSLLSVKIYTVCNFLFVVLHCKHLSYT